MTIRLHRIRAMLLEYFYISLHSGDRIFDVLYWPILDVFIWGFMTYFIQGISEFNIISSIMGGIILWLFIWRGSQDIVVYILEHYWSRSIYHLFVTPLQRAELVISLFILGIIRTGISFVLISVLGFLLYRFNVFNFGLEIFLFIAILLLIAWAIGLFVSSLIFRFGTRIQVLAWSVIWIVQPFSCVFYPLSSLPTWAQYIARVNPVTYIFEGMRAALSGGGINYGSLLYSFVFSILLLAIASVVFVRSMDSARKQGTFAKPE